MRRALVLILVAAAVPAVHGQGPRFLNRPMGDWIKDLSASDPKVRRGAASRWARSAARAARPGRWTP